jgi:sugar lactone lactonase YvrE
LGLLEKENIAMKSVLRIGLSCLFFIQLSFISFAQSRVINTIVGNGIQGYSGDNGTAAAAQLNYPHGAVMDSAGNLFIADTYNHRIRKVDTLGIISTVAGTGNPGRTGDGGSATSATLNFPYGIALDSAGNLFIADTFNHSIRQVSLGVITTVAGTGAQGFNGDNIAATAAKLNYPYGVAVDSAGNIYIADGDNIRIRKVSSGIITTVAGDGTPGFSGDDGPAVSARLNYPNGIAVDTLGNLFIADTFNNRIRRISLSVVINTIAGNGNPGYSGDGFQATAAKIFYPSGITIDTDSGLLIADQYNGCIRKLSSAGTITTVAGIGSNGYSGDSGLATTAMLNYPFNIAVDPTGNYYISDTGNSRIRKVSTAAILDTYVYFPQVAIGGGWSTTFALANTGSTTASGNLILTDNQGNPLTVNSSSLGIGSTFPVSIPEGGTMFLSVYPVSVNDAAKIGWAKVVTANGTVNGVATYQSVSQTVVQTATGVLASQSTQYATIPIDENVSQNRKAAYAIANQTNGIVTIRAALVDLNGIVVDDSVTITLNPGQQIAKYFDQDYPARQAFQGSLVLRGQAGGTFIAVSLLQNQQFFTAIPVIPNKAINIPN